MTILQFIGFGACCASQQLVPKADTHTWTNVFRLKKCSDMLYGLATLFRITRTIGKEKSVKLQLVEVKVPWHTNDFDTTLDETADDVGLHTAIHEHHLFCFRTIRAIGHHLLATHLLHPIYGAVVNLSRPPQRGGGPSGIICPQALPSFGGAGGGLNPPHHHAMLPDHLGQSTGIYACNSRNLLALQP